MIPSVESCKEQAVPRAARISGHVNVTKHSVPALKVAIKQHGPAVVLVDSSPRSFLYYSKGVLYDDRCSKKSSKHAVVTVGWGQERGEPYFILKNSWSEAWGEGGYIRLQARANTCGVLTHPSYPRLEDDDVLS
ncbi:cathepsin K-like [Maniola hyperantus]|uniref:cathepsin K-like n=1 Tax=Aphantopus hyperantus TaxID=2795564 RepID=UPI003748B708